MIFYCPKCGKFNANYRVDKSKAYVAGVIDGVNTGIYHTKCDCGNYLAGYMDIQPESFDSIRYVMRKISDYNRGGSCYSRRFKRYIEQCLKIREELIFLLESELSANMMMPLIQLTE